MIPDGATDISGYAFQGCDVIQDIEIPFSVSSIGREAFDGCTLLSNVTFVGRITEEISSTFANYPWGIEDVSIIRGDGGIPQSKTVFTFTDGTQEMYDWSGELSSQTLIAVGLKSDDTTWIKNPVEVRIG